MSLYALADHMASKGRNGDSVLVHMTPGEVQGLQVLALAHGGSLTINPETGLPEANFLKKLLPAVAGFALNTFVPGLGSAIGGALGVSAAAGTGIAVGGLSALATGSLSRGLMAGLGAYGGAGLAEGLMGAGAGSMAATDIAAQHAAGNFPTLAEGATQAQIDAYTSQVGAVRDAALKKAGEAGVGARLREGISAAGADPMGFAKSAARPLMLAAMGADAMVPTSTKMPTTEQSPSYIRPYIFDQYTHGLQALPVIDASTIRKKASGMASGGVVALANGGTPAPGSAQYIENVRNWFAERPEATHADIQAAVAQYGLNPADVQSAMQQAGMSGAARYSAESPVIGSTANVEEDYSGLKGLSSNINYWLAQNPTATLADVQNEMQRWDISDEDILRATGKRLEELFAPKKTVQPTQGPIELFTPSPVSDVQTPYGSGPATGIDYKGREVSIATPGDVIFNPDGSTTVVPNIPGRPYGGFTGIEQLKSAYTAGGGSLGQTNLFVPRTVEEMYERYGNTGGSQQAYDYLMGKGAVDIKKPILKTGELMLPYHEVMGLRPRPLVLKKKPKPKTKEEAAEAALIDAYIGGGDVGGYGGISAADAAAASGANAGAVGGGGFGAAAGEAGAEGGFGGPGGVGGWAHGGKVKRMALGGLGALAGGGQAGYNLGGYSDGGRLLKGPGDGVSDSIPATIGGRQPARLAAGEFVIPARIVSEIGNGSTDAGARKLYAMMDRVQRARGKTIGKGRVAKDTKAEKYLPA